MQMIAVMIIVCLAILYAIWRVYKLLKVCPGCDGCALKGKMKEKPTFKCYNSALFRNFA